MAELNVMPVRFIDVFDEDGKRLYVPELKIDPHAILSDFGHLSNEQFGRLCRYALRAWVLKTGKRYRKPTPPEVREVILERDGATCAYCGAEHDLTIDHILAVAAGGSDDLDNLCVACRSCNASKWANPLSEWLEARNA